MLGILVWQEGGEAVGAALLVGALALGALAWWLVRQQARPASSAHRSGPLALAASSGSGITGQMLQQIALGGLMIVLPIFLQMVLGTTRSRPASRSRRCR